MPTQEVQINKCIYCGGVGQTDEHIMPFALAGKSILRKASCETCRDITSRCEDNPLRQNWAVARAVLDYPSRKRDFDKEVFPLEVVLKDGTKTVLQLKRSETVGFAPFMEYPLPAFFTPSSNYKSGVVLSGHTLVGFGPDIKILIEKYGIKEIKYKVTHKSNYFEIMVAKIAYCAAVAAWGLDALQEKFVLPAILGAKDDVGYWMGCDPEGKIIPMIGKLNEANSIKLGVWQRADDENKYIIARIKCFSPSDAPEYIVVVGTLK